MAATPLNLNTPYAYHYFIDEQKELHNPAPLASATPHNVAEINLSSLQNCSLSFVLTNVISYPAITSLNEISDYLLKNENGEIDPNQAVLFDLEGTLVDYHSKILRQGVNSLIKKLELQYGRSINSTNLMSIILKEAEQELIEKESTPALINKLLDQILFVFGLTQSRTGSFGVIDCMEKRKFEVLSKLGIRFSLFDTINGYTFPELNSLLEITDPYKEYPIFYNGSLLTGKGGGSCNTNANAISKGKLFLALLHKLIEEKLITEYPNQVIAIDDKPELLDSLKEECAKENIPFIGLHFIRKNQETIDPSEEKRHLEILVKDKKWVD